MGKDYSNAHRGYIVGLRSHDWGGIVRVTDAKTGKFKRFERSKAFSEIMAEQKGIKKCR